MMRKHMITVVAGLAACLALLSAAPLQAAPEKDGALKPQETCPIMGGKIDKTQFVDVEGFRVYVCCPGCFGKIKADPKAAIATLLRKGQQPEVVGAADKKLAPQTTCPIMNKQIDKTKFVDAAGFRTYVCCPGCLGKVKADPEAAALALAKKGQAPETRLAVCTKCGELKGAKSCCADGKANCAKCGLHKGSPGCCKDLKASKAGEDVLLCPSCGEVKGSAKCCATAAASAGHGAHEAHGAKGSEGVTGDAPKSKKSACCGTCGTKAAPGGCGESTGQGATGTEGVQGPAAGPGCGGCGTQGAPGGCGGS